MLVALLRRQRLIRPAPHTMLRIVFVAVDRAHAERSVTRSHDDRGLGLAADAAPYLRAPVAVLARAAGPSESYVMLIAFIDIISQKEIMAHIHRISGSTQYLINGVQPIQGKKLATLEEIQHFYDHYDEILADARLAVERQQDAIILGLSNDENNLATQLQMAIEQQTAIVDTEINELKQKMTIEKRFFLRVGYRLRHWYVVAFRERHIHGPSKSVSKNLQSVRYRKHHHISARESVIQRECYSITRSYEFVKTNETFLIGAQGEEVVISALSQLPDEFHVLNDVNLHFHKAIHWREMDEYIKNCQIDHIVVGPTGVFLLETKNWKSSDIEVKSDKLKHQVRRASLALWYFTKDYYFGKKDQPKVFSVVISLNGSTTGRKLGRYIDVISPYQLQNYIAHRDSILSENAIDKFVKIISRTY